MNIETTTTHPTTEPSFISPNPQTLTPLSRVSRLVTEFFQLSDPPTYNSPYVWWLRSKAALDISHPMPRPVKFSRSNGKRPVWHQEQILHWYGQWQGLEVKECVEAGDNIHDGVVSLSEYRVTK